MKILHITYSMGYGGIETMLINIVNEQIKENHEIHVLTINDIVDTKLVKRLDPRVKFHCIKRKVKSKNILDILKLNNYIRKYNPDIIHTHTSTIIKYIFPPFRKKVCTTQHAMCRNTDAKYLAKSTHVFAISNVVKESITTQINKHVDVVYNGIPINQIESKKHKEKPSTFNIVQVSRLFHDVKGQDIIIMAARRLKENGYTNFHIDFIGDGDSKEYLVQLVEKYQLSDLISFLGSKSQEFIFKNLSQYDLAIQASRREGFGLTVAEAMSARTPVLVSEHPSLLEVIDQGRYGYYFKNYDPINCAQRIEHIINNPKERLDIAEEGYQRVCQLFNIETTAQKYIEYYNKIIEKTDASYKK